MHFKIILLLTVSFLFNQSLLNRALGEQQFFGDARSYSMGFTHSVNTYNSSLIRHNPSLIGLESKGLSIDFQMKNSFIKERRSILVKDYFGDFLTYADYVNNDNTNSNFQLGGMAHIQNKFGVGLAVLPLASFNYNYIEEVRGSASVEDGDVGFKDPLVGYHVFNPSGELNTLSAGLSFDANYFNIGFGFHKVLPLELKDDIHVDSLTTDIQNFSLVEDYYSKKSFDDLGQYYSLGLSFKTNELLFTCVLEPDLLISEGIDSTDFDMDAISYLNNNGTAFNWEGLYHYKPEKLIFGLSYNPMSNRDLTVSAEVESNQINTKNNNLKDYEVYKLGFEYILPSSIPVRAGLIHQTSAIALIPNQSILTFGTGHNFKNIIYDIGLSYTLFDYFYPDLFPIDDSNQNSFDKITESKLNILLTVQYLLK